MSFLRAARAALAGQSQSGLRRISAAVVGILILAGLSLSCSSNQNHGPNHFAYVTVTAQGAVLLLQINGGNGAVTVGGTTPPQQSTSPIGLALTPSKQFLYTANSRADTISTYNVQNNGTLSLSGPPMQAGNGPDAAVVDPTGQYLLVTNNFSNNISVFSINSSTGVLSPVGSPVFANANPTNIVFTHSGLFVYATNPGDGVVTGFSFDPTDGTLTQLPSSPAISGMGAAALVVDASDQYLYVANSSASNPFPYTSTIGNISGFTIDSHGALTPLLGSPFTVTNGNNPTAVAIDPTGRFLYAFSSGSTNSVWCFSITPTNGELVLAANSPFSVASGGQFALFDPTGNFLYIGTQSGHGLLAYTYNSSTGALVAVTGSPFSTGAAPANMVISQ
ncbi:MAG: beta-propeller fold lactonase family protein [Terriglobales bacterium]